LNDGRARLVRHFSVRRVPPRSTKAVPGEYKRHGTTTLFAALDVVTGLVKAGDYRRRRRVEFLHFMNRVVVDHPGREIHVILDNLNTHLGVDVVGPESLLVLFEAQTLQPGWDVHHCLA
jgi:hypothetical protein